jgi:hypothetical protein
LSELLSSFLRHEVINTRYSREPVAFLCVPLIVSSASP